MDGFLPRTYCSSHLAELTNQALARYDVEGDGDPLDICVLTEKDVTHGDIIVRARPIGGLRLLDHDQADDKIIAVLKNDAVYGHLTDIDELPKDIIRRLIHYFTTYKDIPGENSQRMKFISIYGAEVAKDVILRSMQDYQELIAAQAADLPLTKFIRGFLPLASIFAPEQLTAVVSCSISIVCALAETKTQTNIAMQKILFNVIV